MAHVHFDLDDIGRQMRRMRDEQLPLVLSAARTDLQREGYLAQDRLFEAIVSAQTEMMRMLNEGRDDRFIGVTIGAFIGTVIVNTLAAAEDEAASLAAMQGAMDRAIDAYLGDDGGGISTAMIEVAPLQSGRA